jgi:hypothetical protein
MAIVQQKQDAKVAVAEEEENSQLCLRSRERDR